MNRVGERRMEECAVYGYKLIIQNKTIGGGRSCSPPLLCGESTMCRAGRHKDIVMGERTGTN